MRKRTLFAAGLFIVAGIAFTIRKRLAHYSGDDRLHMLLAVLCFLIAIVLLVKLKRSTANVRDLDRKEEPPSPK